ncbi:MAG: alpha-2-macroglobulin family protein [bacterium]
MTFLARARLLWLAVLASVAAAAAGATPVSVETAPSGTVKNVRQFTARFSEPMVRFGDPRLADPMEVSCPVPGRGRWIDDRTWAYDFARALPGGLQCRFTLRDGQRSVAGAPVETGRAAGFSTGGPAIVAVAPRAGAGDGDGRIGEDQVFVLALDAHATTASVLAHAYCSADGINERIPVRMVTGSLRAAILARSELAPVGEVDSGGFEAFLEASAGAEARSRRLLVRCSRELPGDRDVRLVWGRGIATPDGVATSDDQVLAFRTRPAFRARFSCTRANQAAQCIPVLPMRVAFTAPIPASMAKAVTLRGPDGRRYAPVLEGEDRPDAGGDVAAVAAPEGFVGRLRGWWSALTGRLRASWRDPAVDWVEFRGPFQENASFTLELPPRLRDDAGRPLANADSFPLTVRTDEDPPLIRFAARFGLVEANAGALLPVTVRNLDAGSGADGTQGRLLRVESPTPRELVMWMQRASEHGGDGGGPGKQSILRGVEAARDLSLPRTTGPREFEVIGIPLQRPGFYVVEFASRRLGAALHDTPEAQRQREAIDRAAAEGRPRPSFAPPAPSRDPYYVPATALVTNLVAHFKRGREGSLVWVTSLDRGEPVEGARVRVLDCDGRTYHEGMSDRDGLVRVEVALPTDDLLPGCESRYDRRLMVMASRGEDFTFTMTGWDDGIAPWRFNLPTGDADDPYSVRAVLDRSLLRAGETLHLKLFARERRRTGFALPPPALLVPTVVIEHLGSEQKYEVPVQWEPRGGSALGTWDVPKDARLGAYRIVARERLPARGGGSRERTRELGEFRVEQFRLPTMRAAVRPPALPLVGASEASVDVQLAYLAGGPAGGAAVRLRTAAMPRTMGFPGYEGFVFANGDVAEGVIGSRTEVDLLDELDGGAAEPDSRRVRADDDALKVVGLQRATLDAAGGARLRVAGLPAAAIPQDLLFELEYRDANGETLTASARSAWLPSAVVVGLRADDWARARDRVKMEAVVVDPSGKPMAGVPVTVDMFRRETFSHRRRLLGGFYAFESYTETSRLGTLCSARTDAAGRLSCEGKPPASGNLILRARAVDAAGRPSIGHREVWIAGGEPWWFSQQDSDRMDVLPEAPRYEPGQTARFQVRMPFRSATVLVTHEREGVVDAVVRRLAGDSPVIEVPVLARHAPNMFVSVLAVRGRAGEVQPTATVDLGKPAFRMGIGEIAVGWRAHELKVQVRPEREVYRVRERARVNIRVTRADGSIPPVGSEIALAAVDEALLELAPNDTWALLQAMMGRRGIEVQTATAQMHVVGRRHFGKKAVLSGGGGGRQSARELFDTLLAWRGRVALDANGEAVVEVPLNDSLSAFRIVAIASAGDAMGAGLFGTGSASLRTTQDLMLLSSLPALAREGDRFDAEVVVRNASERAIEVMVSASVTPAPGGGPPGAGARPSPAAPMPLAAQALSLAPGEAKPARWAFQVPAGVDLLAWEIAAGERGAASADRLRVAQRIVPAVPVRTLQATLVQLAAPGEAIVVPVQRPADALPGRGAIEVSLARTLGGDLRGVREYMQQYPYSCLEQQSSRAIALGDRAGWDRLMASLPAWLDRDGFARYFPSMREGSDVLTSYLLTVSHEAGWPIPKAARDTMADALRRFVEGRVSRASEMPAADLLLRKLAALDALARSGVEIEPRWLDALSIAPQSWPTSALLDWQSLLRRATKLPDRERRLEEAARILRARLTMQGTVMGFSTEKTDQLWWLMVSGDVNANRMLIAALDDPRAADEAGAQDLARLARGALSRQQSGRWNTTVANAWGVLALARFAARFEAQPVAGRTVASTGGAAAPVSVDWSLPDAVPGTGREASLPWPEGAAGSLTLRQDGSGRPWATVRSRAAVPLRERLDAGFRVEREVSAVQQKVAGRWSVGDLMRVRLTVDAQADMTWVVLTDPVPAGATIIGSGLGGQSSLVAEARGARSGRMAEPVAPVFEERSFEGWRGYWRYVPRGGFSAEYVVRLNQAGRFELPPTRVEAMYAPEMSGERPNLAFEVAR